MRPTKHAAPNSSVCIAYLESLCAPSCPAAHLTLHARTVCSSCYCKQRCTVGDRFPS